MPSITGPAPARYPEIVSRNSLPSDRLRHMGVLPSATTTFPSDELVVRSGVPTGPKPQNYGIAGHTQHQHNHYTDSNPTTVSDRVQSVNLRGRYQNNGLPSEVPTLRGTPQGPTIYIQPPSNTMSKPYITKPQQPSLNRPLIATQEIFGSQAVYDQNRQTVENSNDWHQLPNDNEFHATQMIGEESEQGRINEQSPEGENTLRDYKPAEIPREDILQSGSSIGVGQGQVKTHKTHHHHKKHNHHHHQQNQSVGQHSEVNHAQNVQSGSLGKSIEEISQEKGFDYTPSIEGQQGSAGVSGSQPETNLTVTDHGKGVVSLEVDHKGKVGKSFKQNIVGEVEMNI